MSDAPVPRTATEIATNAATEALTSDDATSSGGTVTTFAAGASGRLDVAIIERLPTLSRSQARRLIEDGRVTVDGERVAKAGGTVAAGARICVDEPVPVDMDALSSAIPLDILYEDEETLVLNKQAGLIVHPREGVQEATLINAVRSRYPEVADIDDSDRGGIVHRLDRDTTGVIALAKSEESQVVLKEQWRARETAKYYLAIVEGRPEPAEGIIEAPLSADPEAPHRRAVVEGGQSARSQYRVLEQYGDEAALVEVRIFTGRTHQIRVHMLATGHPVVGDFLYGRTSTRIRRMALHAWRLSFTLVSTGEWRTFEAPLHSDMRAAIEGLRAEYGVRAAIDLGADRGSDRGADLGSDAGGDEEQ